MSTTLWARVLRLSSNCILETCLVKVNLFCCLLVHQDSFLAVGGGIRNGGSPLERNRRRAACQSFSQDTSLQLALAGNIKVKNFPERGRAVRVADWGLGDALLLEVRSDRRHKVESIASSET